MVVALIAVSFAGCADQPATPGATPTPTPAPAPGADPVQPAELEHRGISIGTLWPFTDPLQANPMRMLYLLSEQWMNETPGADIEFQLISTNYPQYVQQIRVLAASNSLPDVFQYQQGSSMIELLEHNFITDLDQLFTELGLMDEVNPVALNIIRVGDPYGRFMSIPMELAYHGLWVNTQILDELGLEYDESGTWDDLFELGVQIAAAGYVPIAINGRDGWNMTTFMHVYQMQTTGVGFLSDASWGRNNVRFTDQPFIDAAHMMRRFGEAGIFGPDFMAVDHQGHIDQLLQGQAVMAPMTTGFAGSLDNPELNTWGEGVFEFRMYPSVPGSILSANEQRGLKEMQTGMGFVVGARELDDSVRDWISFVFSRYGNFAWENAGFIPSFHVTSDVPAAYHRQMGLDMLDHVTDGELWFEAKLPGRGIDYAFRNISLVAAGHITPEEYMATIQDIVDEDLAG